MKAGERTGNKESAYGGPAMLIFVLFLAVFTALSLIPLWIPLLYLIMSLLTFLVYTMDKRAAKKDRWRVPEKRLHTLEFCCGWPGALLAQQIVRHKSQKVSFRRIFWLMTFFNVTLLGTCFTPQGTDITEAISKELKTIVEHIRKS
ncbi:MAG: DUF1294 domain-containing protein [Opitutales bacterium]|nr:DUF1294 domain-containing protein [Opitutales bacterium]